MLVLLIWRLVRGCEVIRCIQTFIFLWSSEWLSIASQNGCLKEYFSDLGSYAWTDFIVGNGRLFDPLIAMESLFWTVSVGLHGSFVCVLSGAYDLFDEILKWALYPLDLIDQVSLVPRLIWWKGTWSTSATSHWIYMSDCGANISSAVVAIFPEGRLLYHTKQRLQW